MGGRWNSKGTTVSVSAYCIFQAKRMLSFGSPPEVGRFLLQVDRQTKRHTRRLKLRNSWNGD
jgi:hypothetical protein